MVTLGVFVALPFFLAWSFITGSYNVKKAFSVFWWYLLGLFVIVFHRFAVHPETMNYCAGFGGLLYITLEIGFLCIHRMWVFWDRWHERRNFTK